MKTLVVRGVLVATLVMLPTISCSGGSGAKPSATVAATPSAGVVEDSPAVQALTGLLDTFQRQDWSAAYDSLDPAQRKLVNKDLFVRCSKEGNSVPIFQDVKVVRDETEHGVTIPGTDVKQDGELLSVEATVNGQPFKQDMHEYNVNGQWYWATTEDAMKSLIAGKCFTLE